MGACIVVNVVGGTEVLKSLRCGLVGGPVGAVEGVQDVADVDNLDGLALEGHGAGGQVGWERAVVHGSSILLSGLTLHKSRPCGRNKGVGRYALKSRQSWWAKAGPKKKPMMKAAFAAASMTMSMVLI